MNQHIYIGFLLLFSFLIKVHTQTVPSDVFAVTVGSSVYYKLHKIRLSDAQLSSYDIIGYSTLNGVDVSSDGSFAIIATEKYILKFVFSGNIVSVIAGQNSLSRVDGSGASAAFNVLQAVNIYLDDSYAIATDFSNNAIRKINLTSPYSVTTIAGTCSGSGVCTSGFADNAVGTSATLNKPTGLAIHPSGTWAAFCQNTGAKLIRRLDLVNGKFSVSFLCGKTTEEGYRDGSCGSTSTSAIFDNPLALSFPSDGTKLYIMDKNYIRLFNIVTNAVTTVFNHGSGLNAWGVSSYVLNDNYLHTSFIAGRISKGASTSALATFNSPKQVSIWRCRSPGYGSETSETCVKCPAGKYGNYYTGGVCLACANGTFNSAVGQSICSNCSACSAERTLSACTAIQNTVCDEGPIPCPPSMIRKAGSSNVSDCFYPVGVNFSVNINNFSFSVDDLRRNILQSQDLGLNITFNYLEKSNVFVEAKACPAGFVCPVDSLAGIACVKGTYNNMTNAFSNGQCNMCPVGFYCPEASVNPTRCPIYTTSLQGQDNILQCTCLAGYYCTYAKRIFGRVTLNMSASAFDESMQSKFKKAIAASAGVTESDVVILGVNTPLGLGGRRRMLSVDSRNGLTTSVHIQVLNAESLRDLKKHVDMHCGEVHVEHEWWEKHNVVASPLTS